MRKYTTILWVAVVVASAFLVYKTMMVQQFFPPNAFSDDRSQHDFKADWYSRHLAAMKETPLPARAKDKDAVIFRFTCLRTFHRPFAIRITGTNDGFDLERTVLSGQGGYEPGEIQDSSKSQIQAEKVGELEKLLADIQFYEMKSIADGGLDGSQWIVEVVNEGQYKVVDSWTPQAGSPIRKLGDWFLDASEWSPKELY